MSLRILCLTLSFAVMALSSVPPAQAQSSKQNSRNIDQLEKQVKALQRRVFSGDRTYFEQNDGDAAQVSGGGSRQTTAALIVRLDALEETMRSLTGQLEEMRYQQRLESERLEAFMAQANYRLNALDGAGPKAESANGDSLTSQVGVSASTAQAPAADSFEQTFKSPDGVSDPVSSGSSAIGQTLPDLSQPVQRQQDVAQTAALPQDPKARFDDAFQLARRDRFDDAEQAFMMFISDYPDHELASNAQYWLGRVYTAKRQTSQAAEAFFEGYRKYPEGNKAPENLLAFASTLRVMEKPKEACTALKLLKSKVADNTYPDISERVLQGIDSENSALACQ